MWFLSIELHSIAVKDICAINTFEKLLNILFSWNNKQPLSIKWCDVIDHVTRIKDLEYPMHNKQPTTLVNQILIVLHNSIKGMILLKCF